MKKVNKDRANNVSKPILKYLNEANKYLNNDNVKDDFFESLDSVVQVDVFISNFDKALQNMIEENQGANYDTILLMIDLAIRQVVNKISNPLILTNEIDNYLLSKMEEVKLWWVSKSKLPLSSAKILTVEQIALVCYFNEVEVNRKNANQIALKYGQKSGEKIYQRCNFYSKKGNRDANPDTMLKLKNKIKLFNSILPYVTVNKNGLLSAIEKLESYKM